MDRNQLERLCNEGKSSYTIANILDSSQTNIRYWMKKYNLTTFKSVIGEKKCIICNNNLTTTQVKFCSNNCKQKSHYTRLKEANPNSTYTQLKKGQERKAHFVNLRGGKCEKCGYNKNLAVLQFHHNQGIKNYNLDMRVFSNLSIKKLEKEVTYCEVLCANCHAEQHYPQYENW